jgi:DNA-binding MarR family transcriptional regulator
MIHFGHLEDKESKPMTEEERQQLIQNLVSQQNLIGRMMEKSLLSQWLDLDLTLSQLKILLLLNTHSWLKMSKLVDAMKRNLATTTEVVDKLVAHRLVIRSEHQEDRQVVIVAITEEGRALCETLSRTSDNKMIHLLQKLSLEDLNVLLQASDIYLKVVVGGSTARAEG